MAALSGQRVVITAGTAVRLHAATFPINGPLMVKALDTNTGFVAIGSDGAGDVTLSNGLRLDAGEVIVFSNVGDLFNLWLDAGVSGEGVSWLMLDV